MLHDTAAIRFGMWRFGDCVCWWMAVSCALQILGLCLEIFVCVLLYSTTQLQLYCYSAATLLLLYCYSTNLQLYSFK